MRQYLHCFLGFAFISQLSEPIWRKCVFGCIWCVHFNVCGQLYHWTIVFLLILFSAVHVRCSKSRSRQKKWWTNTRVEHQRPWRWNCGIAICGRQHSQLDRKQSRPKQSQTRSRLSLPVWLAYISPILTRIWCSIFSFAYRDLHADQIKLKPSDAAAATVHPFLNTVLFHFS